MSGPLPVAIVSGGSGGIAPGIAETLAGEGFAVVLTARGAAALESAAALMARLVDGPIVPLVSDATDKASIERLVSQVLDRFGRIDLLVNAAASSTPINGAIEDLDVNKLIADLDTKVGGYLRYSQAVVPSMKAAGGGRIVNIGGLTGRSSDALSGLRNAAISHMTKVLSDQLGPAGITVNAVNPGFVRTPHLDDLFAEMAAERGISSKQVEAEFIARIPSREIMTPVQVGRVVAFLASRETASINGQSISVDGGYGRGIYL